LTEFPTKSVKKEDDEEEKLCLIFFSRVKVGAHPFKMPYFFWRGAKKLNFPGGGITSKLASQ